MGSRAKKSVSPINVAVLSGTLTRPPSFRTFDAAPSITSLDVKVRIDEKITDVVRVTWFEAPAWALELDEGDAVTVTGRVRRYWFGGGQSPKTSVTDVVADNVIAGSTPAKMRRALAGVLTTLEDAVA